VLGLVNSVKTAPPQLFSKLHKISDLIICLPLFIN
jgi:hypothetical protein